MLAKSPPCEHSHPRSDDGSITVPVTASAMAVRTRHDIIRALPI